MEAHNNAAGDGFLRSQAVLAQAGVEDDGVVVQLGHDRESMPHGDAA